MVIDGELDALNRAHRLFAANPGAPAVDAKLAGHIRRLDRATELSTGGGRDSYRLAVHAQREALRATAAVDAATAAVVAAARNDHALAREQTGDVVAEARAARAIPLDTPLARREALRRSAARLRAQHAHVLTARQRAQRHRAALRRLHYRNGRRHDNRLTGVRRPSSTSRAGRAVRAALSRLGRPYLWGAAGPDRFDCSGLTQWSYAQAGVPLDRTTYEQIHAGIAVPRSQIRPGDLVFPSAGHVQLAIGNGLVVEAPHAGAAVRISPLGTHLTIRRPLP